MAKTVQILGSGLNEKQQYVIEYKEKGRDIATKKYVFPGSALYDTLCKHPLKAGVIVDMAFKKEGEFWNLDKIGKEGTLNTFTDKGYKSNFKSKPKSDFTANPDRELSMELSGLMQAIISKEGTNDLSLKTKEVYLIKKALMQWVKDGAIMEEPSVKLESKQLSSALEKLEEEAVVDFNSSDNSNDNSPW